MLTSLGNPHPLAPIATAEKTALHVHDVAHNAVLDHLANLGIVVVGHVLRADLDDPLVLLGFLAQFFRHVELRPVRQRLLAVDVFACPDGVDRLRRVVPVGRGDANDVDLEIGEQFFVLAVDFPTGILCRRFGARSIHVAYGHRLDESLFLELITDIDVGQAAPADADEPDADPLVGALGLLGHDGEGRGERRRRAGRGRGAKETASTALVAVRKGLLIVAMHGKGSIGWGNGRRAAGRALPPRPAGWFWHRHLFNGSSLTKFRVPIQARVEPDRFNIGSSGKENRALKHPYWTCLNPVRHGIC